MNAGPNYIYLWADGDKIKKPISVSARKYVDYLFTWIQAKFDDESVFPTSLDKPFPKDFRKLVSACACACVPPSRARHHLQAPLPRLCLHLRTPL